MGVVLSRRIEQPEARILRIQPPEMIHLEHRESFASTMPTNAAGVRARPVMDSKATPARVVEKYLVDIKYKVKN